ncbi:MAG: hypothetical protein RDU25_00705 [Patescibacteria group bacterium]|nr:hypothetical protein [Patescibacteria group bacterium]
MQLQNFSPESRANPMLERIRARETSPESIARELRHEGDAMVTETKSEIEAARRSLQESGDQNTLTQLKALEDELDDAWDALEGEVSGVFERQPADTPEVLDSGWDIEETSEEIQEAENTAENLSEQIDSIEKKIDELFWSENCPLETLEEMSSNMGVHEEVKKAALDKLANDLYHGVGHKYAERLFSDPSYIAELKRFRTSLDEKISGTEIKMMEVKNLRGLIAVKEIFGNVENLQKILSGMELSRYSDELRLEQDGSPIQLIDFNFDPNNGSIETSLNFQLSYNEGQGFINRDFRLTEAVDESGDEEKAKSVKHAVFKLPDNMKSNGIAAKVLESCLAGYRDSDIDTIKLHANIDVGGYAWASYGFDWDEDEMTKLKFESDSVRDANQQGGERLNHVQTGQIKKNAAAEYQNLSAERKQEIFVESIREFLDSCKLAFEGVCMSNDIDLNDPELINIIAEFDELMKNPEAATPQAIAKIGRDSKFKLYRDREGLWYKEEQRQEMLANGTATEKDFIKFHPGKIAMFGTSWYGKVHGDEQFSKIENKAKRST